MADGKITLYGELESGVPNGKIVDYNLVANTPDVYTKEEIDDKLNGFNGGGNGGGTPSGDLSEYAKIAYVDDEVQKAKDYTDEQIGNIDIPELPTLADVATSGSYNDLKDKPTIPSVEGLASEAYVDEKVSTIKVPTALSELSQDDTHLLVTKDEKQKWDDKSDFSGIYDDLKNKPTIPDVSDFETKDVVAENLAEAKRYTDEQTAVLATKEEVESSLSTKQDKTAIVTATDAVSAGNRSVINVNGDVVITLTPYEDDGYAHSYEIVLNVGDTAYAVTFPANIKWVKPLEITPNARYFIIIEDNTAMWTAVSLS